MTLVHWIYRNQEWNRFLIRKFLQGQWFKLLRYMLFAGSIRTPQVRITPERVFIGSRETLFSSGRHRISRITIKEAGKINIIEITYQKSGNPRERNIQVPVPKGKLVEAFEVEERLRGG